MKLATLSTPAGVRLVGVIGPDDAPQFVDLSATDSDLPNSMRQMLARPDGLTRAATAFAEGLRKKLFITGRLAAPIADPGKILCIGLNYADHAAESGMEPPTEPVVFSKFGNTIVGPDDSIRLPAVSSQVDYEAELVVVIGKPGYNIPRERAWDYVAGYMNGHDVSARDWQIGRPGKQWLLGKTADTFAPIGPWLVTADEVTEPHALD
ncbi:MAG: fumarylacetoacetate hydrolase family protein, partial [Planctomycetaceae bacterium]